MSAATYAWFVTSTEGRVDTFQFTAEAVDGIMISADAQNYGALLTQLDLRNAKVLGVPNSIEGLMAPVSTGGNVSGGNMELFKGQVGEGVNSRLILTRATPSSAPVYDGDTLIAEGNSGYYAFDMFFQNLGESTALYLRDASAVSGKAIDEFGKTLRTELAMRVAFVNLGTTVIGNQPLALAINGAATTSASYIWEPNSLQHAAGVAKIPYYGVIAEAPAGLPAVGNFLDTARYAEYSTYVKNMTTCDHKGNAIESAAITTLEKETVTRIRAYVWLEGEDLECTNAIAEGTVSVDLSFTTDETNVAG